VRTVFGGGRGGAALERLRESAAATAAGCGPAAGRPRSAARAQGNDSGPALVFTPFVGRSPFQGGDRPKQSALPSSALTRILIRTHFSMTPDGCLKASSARHLDGIAMTIFPR